MRKKVTLILLCVLCMMMAGCKDYIGEGTALMEEGSYKEAQEVFLQAAEEGKQPAEAYKGLAICYWGQQDYENAEVNLEAALNAGAKENAVLYNMLGSCAMQLGRPEKAVFYFDEGRDLDGATDEMKKEMTFNLIAAHEATGRYDLAKQELMVYTQAYPDDEEAQKELEFLETQVSED